MWLSLSIKIQNYQCQLFATTFPTVRTILCINSYRVHWDRVMNLKTHVIDCMQILCMQKCDFQSHLILTSQIFYLFITIILFLIEFYIKILCKFLNIFVVYKIHKFQETFNKVHFCTLLGIIPISCNIFIKYIFGNNIQNNIKIRYS